MEDKEKTRKKNGMPESGASRCVLQRLSKIAEEQTRKAKQVADANSRKLESAEAWSKIFNACCTDAETGTAGRLRDDS